MDRLHLASAGPLLGRTDRLALSGGSGRTALPEDRLLLLAVAAHASITLENACLFGHLQQTNQHWLEVFDAIGDFIVVHDEQQNILRVNRSLADFVGIAPIS